MPPTFVQCGKYSANTHEMMPISTSQITQPILPETYNFYKN